MSDAELGESAESLGAFLLRFDAVFSEHGHALVFDATDSVLRLMTLSWTKRISTLIVLLRFGTLNQFERVLAVRERLFELLDKSHSAIAMEAYCADISRHVWVDRADLAVAALLEHLGWLKANGIAVSCNLYLEAAFTCNRFEKPLLAVEFSYLAYNQALASNNSYALDRAIFFVLNANRLADTGVQHIRSGYDREVQKIEMGCSNALLANKFLTLAFASFAELSDESPDMSRVNRYLGIAREIGHPNVAYCNKAWLIASGLQAFHLGKASAARDAYEEIWRCTSREDRAIDTMAEQLGRRLGGRNVYQAPKEIVGAENSAWEALRQYAL